MLTVLLHNRTKTTTCLCLSKKCFNIVRLNSKNAVTGLDGFIPCFDLQQQQAHPQCISNPAPCTHPFNGSLSRTTRVSRYQKGKTNLDFTEARDSEWQWHQLGHTQVCTSLQTDNHASTPPLSFCRPDALPAAQPCQSTEGSTLQRNGNDSSLPYHCLYNMHSTKSTILTTHAFYVTDT